jgi:hypothetical protein
MTREQTRRQIEELRKAQGLTPTVTAERFLQELAREVMA